MRTAFRRPGRARPSAWVRPPDFEALEWEELRELVAERRVPQAALTKVPALLWVGRQALRQASETLVRSTLRARPLRPELRRHRSFSTPAQSKEFYDQQIPSAPQ